MDRPTRRLLLGSAVTAGALSAAPAVGGPVRGRIEGEISASGRGWRRLRWAKGFEGQRKADLGDGRFLNPILAGDHPDPSVLKDGDDYWMTHSSFDAYPGLVIRHSRDLVNWRPVVAALREPIGSVWAPDLVRHDGRYLLYIPARTADYRSIYVIAADRIEGPWSAPVDLKLHRHIDPCHAVGEDGSRWLFLSGGDRVRLADDGLSVAGPVEHVYDPWRYPADWVVEGFSPEGPSITRRGDWFYMLTAVGGTSGPPTGHMVIAARARSVHGPWEQHPDNPLVRTWSADEKWWSRGHASLVEGPEGDWWMVYHGYENGFWTLGRQTLLDPVAWGRDGWFRARGGDLSRPIRVPAVQRSQSHGAPLSDDFREDRLGIQWAFYDPGPDEPGRTRREGGVLAMRGKGSTPSDCSPLTCVAGDQAYEFECDVRVEGRAEAGLLLFYSRELYAGLGMDANGLIMHRTARQRRSAPPPGFGPSMRIKVRNDRHVVTMWTSSDGGGSWTLFPTRMEVSGYNHNTAWDFLSLRPGLYVAGDGEARFADFRYRAV